MNDQQLIHRIALSLLKGIGPVNARNLVAYCGGVDPLFTDAALRRSLRKIPGIGSTLSTSILGSNVIKTAEKELAFIRKMKLRTLFYLDDDYPKRLRQCADAPAAIRFLQS